MIALFQIALQLLADLLALTALALRQRRATAAEILVLRRQVALYKERGIKPRRIDYDPGNWKRLLRAGRESMSAVVWLSGLAVRLVAHPWRFVDVSMGPGTC